MTRLSYRFALPFAFTLLSALPVFAQTATPPAPASPPVTQPWPPPPLPPPGYAPYGYRVPEYAPPAPYLPPEVIRDDGQPLPSGYHRTTRLNKGLVISGAIVFGVPYAFSAAVGTLSDNTSDRWLFLPILGPLFDIFARGSCTKTTYSSGLSPAEPFSYTGTDSECSAAKRGLLLDFVTQGAGVTLFAFGIASPRRVFLRDDAPDASRSQPLQWAIGPRHFGRTGWGLSLSGELF